MDSIRKFTDSQLLGGGGGGENLHLFIHWCLDKGEGSGIQEKLQWFIIYQFLYQSLFFYLPKNPSCQTI